ncbi:hypothetical protein AKJ39_00955 [candidate division MSBL1 archaeon SCGC-AAA259J03]|uniref:Uncharacterized protein n=1 Tax=candidate division MSBL1 archaeon SCGC-AAA259J03 TaxID=1698269 RepID=A0A656YZI8_9EURY|nr:hypothetical protein AKJ39_00955 [candidate division MSBL1 archaeon SCGC-AAA259J03]
MSIIFLSPALDFPYAGQVILFITAGGSLIILSGFWVFLDNVLSVEATFGDIILTMILGSISWAVGRLHIYCVYYIKETKGRNNDLFMIVAYILPIAIGFLLYLFL